VASRPSLRMHEQPRLPLTPGEALVAVAGEAVAAARTVMWLRPGERGRVRIARPCR
jgi:hypothetical protein